MSDDLRLVYGDLKFDLSCDKILSDNCDYRYRVFYDKDTRSELSMLCDKYGSDKGEIATSGHPYDWPSHNYADFYEGKFEHCRDHIKTVFEYGLGSNNPSLPSNMDRRENPGRRSGFGGSIFRMPIFMARISIETSCSRRSAFPLFTWTKPHRIP